MVNNQEMYEYKGVIHVHSRYSDGSASVKKIIKIAQDVGLVIVAFENFLYLAYRELHFTKKGNYVSLFNATMVVISVASLFIYYCRYQ